MLGGEKSEGDAEVISSLVACTKLTLSGDVFSRFLVFFGGQSATQACTVNVLSLSHQAVDVLTPCKV